jgi:voltage-gated potassium channel
VIARASAEDSEQKLRRAGADRVISPYKASGHAMARLALHPQVTGVVEVPPAYRMEEIEISPGCAAAGRRLDAVLGDAFAVGIRLARGTFEFQPPGDTTLEPGDVVLVVGRVETMERLERLSQPPGAPPTASPAEVARRGRGGPAAPGDGPP